MLKKRYPLLTFISGPSNRILRRGANNGLPRIPHSPTTLCQLSFIASQLQVSVPAPQSTAFLPYSEQDVKRSQLGDAGTRLKQKGTHLLFLVAAPLVSNEGVRMSSGAMPQPHA